MKKKKTNVSESKKAKSSQRQTRSIKTRNNGEWTEARFRGFIVSTLRRASLRWNPVGVAKSNSRVSRGIYSCAICGGRFKPSEIVVDHIEPVVPISGFDSWDGYINRMFCDSSGLQVLCNECHKVKTDKENENRKLLKNDSI